MNNKLLKQIKIEKDTLVVNDNYINNGFVLTLINEINNIKVKKTHGYTKEVIQELIEPYLNNDKCNKIQPNIIMIMCEALYDINDIAETKLSEDPLAQIKSYSSEYTGGKLGVSVFGGTTAQTEYEVLTGNMVDFTGSQNIA
ncbi:alkaline phosphatase family protein [Cellulosilyticum ruminicola]|uniref:hypothetical protein n=1 Tax=Cellulosilyticum ruminicola TaxID=425254 RepID=UPI0006CFF534|nr:hypothetical protein [Cellulosilyticum ruminicola]